MSLSDLKLTKHPSRRINPITRRDGIDDEPCLESKLMFTSKIEFSPSDLRDDSNYKFLTTRLQNFFEITESRLSGLRLAITNEDSASVTSIAHQITEQAGKFGALDMMKTGVAIQMLGRRDMFQKAEQLLDTLMEDFEKMRQNSYRRLES